MGKVLPHLPHKTVGKKDKIPWLGLLLQKRQVAFLKGGDFREIFVKLSPFKKILIVISTAVATAVSLIVYFNLKNPQKELAYQIRDMEGVETAQFSRVIGDLMGPPVVDGNKIVGLYNGDEIFPAMLKAIRAAQKTVTFESYIYWSGKIGEEFVEALSERARHGVKVHVLIDWLGSQKIEDSYVERLRNAGVEVERYHVLRWYNLSRINNRTHRKILVVDGRIGFTGGVGIADEWSGNGMIADKWRDTHFQVEGPVVGQMQSAFMDNWLKTRPEVRQSEDYFPELKPVGTARAQMFKSSSREGGSSVRILYMLAIAAARKSIYLESSYFVPDEQTINELVKARQRGVDVQIIVPGPKTDTLVVRQASRAQWGPLLEAGVKFYEYQPAMFHCKVLIVDEYFASIGSTNFDERSFRLNDEANLNVLDHEFARAEILQFNRDRALSREVPLERWDRRPAHSRVLERLSLVLRSQL